MDILGCVQGLAATRRTEQHSPDHAYQTEVPAMPDSWTVEDHLTGKPDEIAALYQCFIALVTDCSSPVDDQPCSRGQPGSAHWSSLCLLA